MARSCDAFQAWMDWDGRSPEPTVEYEINYVPHRISISRACGLVWNCTDTVPGIVFEELQSGLEAAGQTVRRQTYGACAQAIMSASSKEWLQQLRPLIRSQWGPPTHGGPFCVRGPAGSRDHELNAVDPLGSQATRSKNSPSMCGLSDLRHR
jgi:hypothetical protein